MNAIINACKSIDGFSSKISRIHNKWLNKVSMKKVSITKIHLNLVLFQTYTKELKEHNFILRTYLFLYEMER